MLPALRKVRRVVFESDPPQETRPNEPPAIEQSQGPEKHDSPPASPADTIPASQHPNTHPLVPVTSNQSTKKPQLRTKATNDQTVEDVEFLRGIGREAQVWTTYVKETAEFDDEMVDGWNRSLDVTLVFAALFSAILTAFVLESAKKLEPDKADQTVELLREISRTLRARETPSSLVGQSNPNTDAEFHPETNAVWVNCLWFLSLSLSVAVSLAAMLAKQWCYYYLSGRTGDTIMQAEERQKRYNGLAKWRMRGILEHLPMLMHIALALFSVGLILYLWDINVAVASTVTAVSASALCFYLGTISVPLWDRFCPFKTTQSVYFRKLLVFLAEFLQRLLSRLRKNTVSSSRDPMPNHDTNAPSHTTLEVRPGTEPEEENEEENEEEKDDEDEEAKPFVKDALEWLIFNSQKSISIDTAIGALAIGRVQIHEGPLKDRVDLHLIKHYSDCFTLSKNGPKLQLSHHRDALKSALDYVNWMSHFAIRNPKRAVHEEITSQVLCFSKDLDLDLVIRLGLGFASLAEQTNLPHETGKNVAYWLSSFIQCYDTGELFANEEVLSILVDGLTVVGQNVPTPHARSRAKVLAIPNLINILWKVSHIDGSKLRFSLGRNLAVFALTTKLPYPIFHKQSFEVAGHYLASNYHFAEKRDSSFTSFVIFALLGFIHPQSELGLDEGTFETAHKIIQETNYLAKDLSMNIPHSTGFDPLRRNLTSMLIEGMIQTPQYTNSQRWYLLDTAFVNSMTWEDQVFPSVMHAICELITVHVKQSAELYEDAVAATTDLLLGEVKKLPKLDASILAFGAQKTFQEGRKNSPDIGLMLGAGISSDTRAEDNDSNNDKTRGVEARERIASITLALILAKSNNKQCLETAVHAVLYHTYKCDADLVMQATSWFEAQFGDFPGNKEHSTGEDDLLHMGGYVRILTSMALHCTQPSQLAKNLCGSTLYEPVQEKIQLLTESTDPHIHAFGVAGIAIWKFACPDGTYDTKDTQSLIQSTWSQVITHVEAAPAHILRSDAIEALVDTTTLIAATSPTCSISYPEARALLRLLGQFHSEPKEQVRPALALALAFWGLSLDAAWAFWAPKMRQKHWRFYTRSETRIQDSPALFLLGLSRFLVHYDVLQLDHTSIKTIALEIEHYMQHHASHPNTLTLPFLSGFDVRRQVRQSVWSYLQATESHGPFTMSTAASRTKLLLAIQYDGGEGFLYEQPQPFTLVPPPSVEGGNSVDPITDEIQKQEALIEANQSIISGLASGSLVRDVSK